MRGIATRTGTSRDSERRLQARRTRPHEADRTDLITFDREDVGGGVTIVGLRPPRHARDPEWLEFGEQTAFEQYVMAREGGGHTVRHWCDEILCAEERRVWASGPARVRCYRSYAAAAGLDAGERWSVFRPTLVIEQDELQLWCDAGVPDASELLTRDAVRVLELVGLPVPRENRLQRLARRTMRPSAYIDIDEDRAGLRRDPVDSRSCARLAARQVDGRTWNDRARIDEHRLLTPATRLRLTIEASRAALRFAHGRRA